MNESRKPAVDSTLRHGFMLGQVSVDPVSGEMRGPGGTEHLDPKVMEVLVSLAERPGQVVLREELFERAWPHLVVTDHVLSRCIYQLRNHLSRAGASSRDKTLLETLPKRGYRLNCPVTFVEHRADPSAPAVTANRRLSPGRAAGVASVVLVAGMAAWLLAERELFWRDPLVDATYTRLTDFDGEERDAAISRDGKFVAFLSDRDGSTDVWVSEIGTGQFHNLTKGQAAELGNRSLRSLAFSPDGSFVTFWARSAGSPTSAPVIDVWAVDTIGGPLRRYMGGAAELDWSPDANRIVYHPPTPGDPLFVTESSHYAGRHVFTGRAELHSHFPVWSPDAAFIYFTHGIPPNAMDIWRIRPAGDGLERLTFHESAVAFPVFLDEHTLLYLAPSDGEAAPWLYGMNTDRRISHRIGFGVDHYTSLAATGDGRRLVTTVSTPKASIWRIPMSADVLEESAASRIELPTVGGLSPRIGMDYLLYVAPQDGSDVIWKLADGMVTALWSGRRGRIDGAPAISPIDDRIAFSVRTEARTELYVMDSDGTGLRTLAAELNVRGAPAWSPDGAWVAVAADIGNGPRVFRIPVDGGHPIATVDEYSLGPAWSPDGSFIVYSGAEAGPTFPLKAVSVRDNAPHVLPNLLLPRGARRVAVLGDRKFLLTLQGELRHKNFWLVDLESGHQRQLTDFGPASLIGDFDVSADGREIIFDRVREDSDIVVIDLAR
jgi:Tol biopolymer transport system component/DNA-binding winged helix-turn-helix (wHTH) protein